ncbi:hypothetical protein C1H46_017703 [Malus baccata]|uniref:Altered inheritance of mitochondria protein 32 n=1 Tax=Malus baccata TaxID=106549 RepID=A0A540MD99_MALBA|nr:hypothetical protein C1H46_017703 [Malus baccata]
MGSARDRDDSLAFTNPSTSSSPIVISEALESFLSDPNSHIGSASGSFQNEGLLADTSGSCSDAEFGFSRPEFRTSQLAGTVEFYQRHVFLCYKNPQVWPPRIEAAEFDRLPRLLYSAVMARRGDMKKEGGRRRRKIVQIEDLCLGRLAMIGTQRLEEQPAKREVMKMADLPVQRLTHFDVDTFVEEVLVKDGEWLPGTPETLKGSYVFVCSHGSRDRRSGVCGPPLINRFREEVELHGLQGKVSVSPCSHIGGHKYAGNVIMFGSNCNRKVSGHWYGYVAPEDVPVLLEQHVGKGEIVDWLWRGQMGLSEEQQKECQERRLQLNGETNVGKTTTELTQPKEGGMNTSVSRSQVEIGGCCQENGNSCCQNATLMENINSPDLNEIVAKPTAAEKKKSSRKPLSRMNSGKGASTRKVCAVPTWFQTWEREDTYAAVAVVCAAVSVAVAYKCYKQLS